MKFIQIFLLAAAFNAGGSPHSAAAVPCSDPAYHQFDFWIGDWDAFDLDQPAKRVATNRVSRILDGCVLLEDYRGEDGHSGQSFSLYDAATKTWRQTWVTNGGQFLAIEGSLKNGEMVLGGTEHLSNGKTRLVRGVWKRVPHGVRETAVISTDGKTWQPWFDVIFRPAKEK